MLDTRTRTLSTPMRMHSGLGTMEHSYELDHSSKHAANSAIVIAQEDGDEEEIVLRELLAAFPDLSLEAIAAAYTEADADVNAAAEILTMRQPAVAVETRSSSAKDGRKCPTLNRDMKFSKDPMPGPDDFFLQRYGKGVGQPLSQLSNQQENANFSNPMYQKPLLARMDLPSYSENVNSRSSTDAIMNGTSSERTCMDEKKESGVAREGMRGIGKKNKKKKRRKGGIVIAELEPKDAAARRAVEEFLLNMLGEGFQLGQDVVRDVLGCYEGDTQKTLEMLLQLASSTSGLGLNSEKELAASKHPTHMSDAEMKVKVDPLGALMEAFPNADPAQVVMAFQEHNGDMQKVSNALLLAEQGAPKRHSRQKALAREAEPYKNSDERLLHAQLKRQFPSVDSNVLWEILQSANFMLRVAERVLLDAGLTSTSENVEITVPTEADKGNLSSSVVKDFNKVNRKEAITTTEVLEEGWVHVKPVTPVRKNVSLAVMLKESASANNNAGRELGSQFRTHGDADDYDQHRHCAQENWRTMQYYFREATSAYCRGEQSRALILSEKGKYHKRLAREADERASLRIFASRNKDIENNIAIDLHAQHVPEAIQVLKLHLRSLSRILSVHTLNVITGHGSHSSNGRGRIKSAGDKS